jgi:hypothetical protein
LLPPMLPSAISPAVSLEEVLDLFDSLLALDVLFDLDDIDSLFDFFFRNVAGGLAASEVLETTGEVVDAWAMRTMVTPHPPAFSDASEKRKKPAVLMSCFEIRFGSEAPLEMMRGFVAGTVSARVLAVLSTAREIVLRRAAPGGRGFSSSLSESKAEISAACSWKGERSGRSDEGEVGVPSEVVQAVVRIGAETIMSVVGGAGL